MKYSPSFKKFNLTLILVLIAVALPSIALNIASASQLQKMKVTLYFGGYGKRLSEADVMKVEGLKGVTSTWREAELWLREGYVKGLDFEYAEDCPQLLKGNYPVAGETNTVLLSNDTCSKLEFDIGSTTHFFGRDFEIKGMTKSETAINASGARIFMFTAYLQYKTLMALNGSYSDVGDMARYGTIQTMTPPGVLFSKLAIMVNGSYDDISWLVSEVPRQIEGIYLSEPQLSDLQSSFQSTLYEVGLKIIYMISFVFLGYVGVRAWLGNRRKTFDSWLNLALIIIGIVGLYLYSFPSAWTSMWLLGYSFFNFPAIALLISVSCVLSLRSRQIGIAVFEGMIALIGWIALVTTRLPWFNPILPLWAIVVFAIFLVYPILPALMGIIRIKTYKPRDKEKSKGKGKRKWSGVL